MRTDKNYDADYRRRFFYDMPRECTKAKTLGDFIAMF